MQVKYVSGKATLTEKRLRACPVSVDTHGVGTPFAVEASVRGVFESHN